QQPQPVQPRPQPAVAPAPEQEAPRAMPAAPQPQPAQAAPRMPKVEDFPPVVRAEVEARRNPAPAEHEHNGPMGLLKRLTTGLNRRGDEPARLQPAAPREPKLRQPAPEARRVAAQDPQLYAPRRGQLDEHGRLSPQPRSVQEDEQLEIPAFLRRQAN